MEINLQDAVGKVVGRRVPPSSLKVHGADCISNAVQWRQFIKTPFIPRGVYRFKTHEEADEWMWKMITRKT